MGKFNNQKIVASFINNSSSSNNFKEKIHPLDIVDRLHQLLEDIAL
jgi:hypothetical protein